MMIDKNPKDPSDAFALGGSQVPTIDEIAEALCGPDPINLFCVAIAREPSIVDEAEGSVIAEAFDRLGLPFFSDCEVCRAGLGPTRAYLSKTGGIRCRDCIGDLGFATVDDLDAFEERNGP